MEHGDECRWWWDKEKNCTCGAERIAELKRENAGLLAALKELLDTHEAWAKAQLAADNAMGNFTDCKPEVRALEKAIIASSEAERKARAAIARHS